MSFFGVDDVALKAVLELKRQKNAAAKARQKERMLQRKNSNNGRRRKTLQDDVLDKPSLSAAAAKLKVKKESAKKMKGTAFLEDSRPEAAASGMKLEISDSQEAKQDVTVEEKKGRKKSKRDNCFFPRQSKKGLPTVHHM